MARALADLRTACAALPVAVISAPVVCPIFGNVAPPTAPRTAGLPPMLAAASEELARVLAAPAGAMTWPLVDTPGIAAQREARSKVGGRPTKVQPNQVVRLVRWVSQVSTVTAAAKRVGVSRQCAQRILSGQHPMAHHAAVQAAGVFLPAQIDRKARPKPAQNAERDCAAATPASRVPVACNPAAPGSAVFDSAEVPA